MLRRNTREHQGRWSMTVMATEILLKKLENMEEIPTLPIILNPLLKYLEQPLDSLDVQKVADLIAQDKSLAAQCLHLANSSLFGRWQKVDSVRSAVVALGLRRMREIAMSCYLSSVLIVVIIFHVEGQLLDEHCRLVSLMVFINLLF